MSARTGRRTAGVVVVLGLAVLLVAGVLCRDQLLEEYYLRKLGSRDSAERDFAAGKLGRLHSARAVPRLMSLLREEPQELPIAGEAPGSGLILVMDEWPEELPPLWAALADIGLPAVPALLDQLQRSGPRSALWATGILVKMGPPIVPALEARLDDPQEGLRSCAAQVLGQISSPAGKESLGRSLEYFGQEDWLHAREEAEKALRENPWNWQANHTLALTLLMLKDPPAALRHLERAERVRPNDALTLYNLACAHALNGEPEKALDRLEASLKAGFADHEHLMQDPDLESLRETERYRRLLSRISPGPR